MQKKQAPHPQCLDYLVTASALRYTHLVTAIVNFIIFWSVTVSIL